MPTKVILGKNATFIIALIKCAYINTRNKAFKKVIQLLHKVLLRCEQFHQLSAIRTIQLHHMPLTRFSIVKTKRSHYATVPNQRAEAVPADIQFG